MDIFRVICFDISSLVTKYYSSSFYLSTLLLDKKTKKAIHGIYGFVRFADEIVDSFHTFDKVYLLHKFEHDLNEAIEQKISLNPILNAFQLTVAEYHIPYQYINAFLSSMKMDLSKKVYLTSEETAAYIYGSADVIGLMCLKVFCAEDETLFKKLQNPAIRLGSAFQKVNFLRDLKADTQDLGRNYFSNIDAKEFSDTQKNQLIQEIESDFNVAQKGIRLLRGKSKLAVLTAYYYYSSLLAKIKKTPAESILRKRIRISNLHKLILLCKAYIAYRLHII